MPVGNRAAANLERKKNRGYP